MLYSKINFLKKVKRERIPKVQKRKDDKSMKKNILKKFAIAIASTTLALTAPVTMPDASVITIQTVEAATVKTPSTVKLSKISAPAYNKIKVSWRKASNATKYYVYYRKSGTKKWKKIASVKNTSSSYTHKSSSKYPIIVGQKYDYTVKAYNSKYKKSGKYNTKGLTATTKPEYVITRKAIVNYTKPEVDVHWSKAKGCSHYIIYRKTGTNGWKQIATVENTVDVYTDTNPVKNTVNAYTVRGYYAPTKAYGDYDPDGIRATVPSYSNVDPDDGDDDITPAPTYTEEQFAEEIFRLSNIERAKVGQSSLKYHSELQRAAMQRAKEISIKFSHIRPNGKKSDTVSGEFNVGCIVGENIGGATTPDALVEAWMKSNGHRWAILNNSAQYLGVGVHKCADGTFDCVQVFASNVNSKMPITLDANGGTFPTNNNATTITMQVPEGGYYNTLTDFPTPVRDGYTFTGWNMYGTPVKDIYITIDLDFTATWKPNN